MPGACRRSRATVAGAEAVRFDVEVREDVFGGRSWGLAGAYERLAGRIHFEVDPQNSANRIIRDIDYAPLNAAGSDAGLPAGCHGWR